METFFMDFLVASYNIVNIIILIWFLKSFFVENKSRRQIRNILLTIIAIISIGLNILFSDFIFSLLLSLTIYYAIGIVFFEGKLQSKLVVSVFYVIFSFISELLAAVLLSNIFGDVVVEVRENILYMFLGGVTSKLILILLIQSLVRSRVRNRWKVSIKAWMITMTIPLLSILLSITTIYEPIIAGEFSVLSVLACLAILYINIITFYLFDNIIVQVNDLNQYKIREHALILKQEQYKTIMEADEQIKKIRHDMMGHLIVLRGYYSEKKHDKAIEYINQLHKQLNLGVRKVISGNIVVDAMINNRKALMDRMNIKYSDSMAIPTELNIRDVDLSIVLGNLINNAIEACQRLEEIEKEIVLNLMYKKQNLFIEIKNTYNIDSVRMRSGKYISSKTNRGHNVLGTGLENIEEVIDIYNGVFQIELQNDFFIAKAMIPDKEI